MVLRFITVAVTFIPLAGTEDALYGIVVVCDRSEIDESVMQIRFSCVSDTGAISHIRIVIVAEASAKDIPHPASRVFHISSGLGLVATMYHTLHLVTNTTGEISISIYAATEVVATIDMVANPREAVLIGAVALGQETNIGFGMT